MTAECFAMDIALWVVGVWFALSVVVSPMIGLMARANDAPAPSHGVNGNRPQA